MSHLLQAKGGGTAVWKRYRQPTRNEPIIPNQAIHLLLDHMHAVDTKIDRMCKNLSDQGIRSCDEKLPELKDEDFETVRQESD